MLMERMLLAVPTQTSRVVLVMMVVVVASLMTTLAATADNLRGGMKPPTVYGHCLDVGGSSGMSASRHV